MDTVISLLSLFPDVIIAAGAVSMQVFVWKVLYAIHNFSFIHASSLACGCGEVLIISLKSLLVYPH